jgi:hypothetical protein
VLIAPLVDDNEMLTLVQMRAVVHAALVVVVGVLDIADEDRVIGVGLDVLLKVLGTLERFAAELTLVRLQGHMDADVRGDVITLDGGGAARVPLAGEAEVVGALAANMALTDVLLGLVSTLSGRGYHHCSQS